MATPQYGALGAALAGCGALRGQQRAGRKCRARQCSWYRDYVVNAFNADKPYDSSLSKLPATHRRRILRDAPARVVYCHRIPFAGAQVLAEPDKVKMEMDIIDEQIDTLGALLGLTPAVHGVMIISLTPFPPLITTRSPAFSRAPRRWRA